MIKQVDKIKEHEALKRIHSKRKESVTWKKRSIQRK